MSANSVNEVVDAFVASARSSRKYGSICDDTLRDVIRTTLPKYKRTAEAVKAARSSLHAIQAVYLTTPPFGDQISDVRDAFRRNDHERLRGICARMMRGHSSTRERLPLLDGFYSKLFALAGKPRVILDLACGLHPLSIPWMDLADDSVYRGYEIVGNLVDRLNAFLEAIGRPPALELQDILCSPPSEPADLAFLLRAVPCLERRREGTTLELIESLNVRRVVVSFPVASLSGRRRGMERFYDDAFVRMLGDRDWMITRLPLDGELVFVVDKRVE